MNVTHSALTGVAAASGVEKLLQTDTSRPYRPDLALSREPFHGIEVSGVTFAYEGRQPTLQDVYKRQLYIKINSLGKKKMASAMPMATHMPRRWTRLE